MKNYKVISLAISGRGKNIYEVGDTVKEDDFVPGRAAQLVKDGHLEPTGTKEKAVKPEITAKDSIDHIETLASVEAIDAFIEGEERKTVLAAATERKEELNK